MVFMKRGSQFNVPIPLSSTPPPLYVLNFKSQLQLSVVNHLAPTAISKIIISLPPPQPYLGKNHCLVSLEGLQAMPRAVWYGL